MRPLEAARRPMAPEYATGPTCANLFLMRLPVAALFLLLASSTARAETIAGRVTGIDGDTLEMQGERIAF